MLKFRLEAFHKWLEMEEPKWANVVHSKIDYQDLSYYSAPKKKPQLGSLSEVDPEVLKTFERLGIPLDEQKRLANVAVDMVFDSVSIGTTFKKKLEEAGVVLCSISEAIQKYPELVEKYLGTVVPQEITTLQLLTLPYLLTVHLFMFQKGSKARWSFLPTLESMIRRQGSLRGP